MTVSVQVLARFYIDLSNVRYVPPILASAIRLTNEVSRKNVKLDNDYSINWVDITYVYTFIGNFGLIELAV